MNLDKFLNLLATIFGALGSMYVMVGIMNMSPDFMLRLATPYWDLSVPQIEALANQKAENLVGFGCVVVSFMLSSITIAFVPDGKLAFQSKWLPSVLAVVVAVVLYVIVECISGNISHREKLGIGKVAASRYLDTIIKEMKVSDSADLSFYAQLLELKAVSNESTRSLVHRIAAEVGKTLPPTLDYSAIKQNR